MRILVLLSFVSVAMTQPLEFELASTYNYHEHTGVIEAQRIKATEDAQDFDGSRIVGGTPTVLRQYPFMAGLIVTLPNFRESVCGSSLLSTNRLVTAAHCWFDGRNQALRFIVVLQTIRLFSSGTRLVTDRVRMHPNWNPRNGNNDVAVITLNFRVNFNLNIRSIRLATGYNQFVGVKANAVGFGIVADGGQITTLQAMFHVELKVITNQECRQSFPTLTDSMLCTSGATGRGICIGDFGGPLAIGTGANAELIGIASFVSPRGCQTGKPSGFTRVTSFAAWIQGQL